MAPGKGKEVRLRPTRTRIEVGASRPSARRSKLPPSGRPSSPASDHPLTCFAPGALRWYSAQTKSKKKASFDDRGKFVMLKCAEKATTTVNV